MERSGIPCGKELNDYLAQIKLFQQHKAYNTCAAENI